MSRSLARFPGVLDQLRTTTAPSRKHHTASGTARDPDPRASIPSAAHMGIDNRDPSRPGVESLDVATLSGCLEVAKVVPRPVLNGQATHIGEQGLPCSPLGGVRR